MNAAVFSPAQSQKLRSRIENHLEAQQWDKCIDACTSLLQLDRHDHFAQETLATALLQTGQIDAALEAVGRLLQLSPRDPLHRLRFAAILQMQGRNGEALREFERVIAMYPDAPFCNEAREAIEQLDRMQTQQILLMAAEHNDFRWMLERDMTEALESSNFHLSENGFESLRQMIPGSEDPISEPPIRFH